MDYRKALTVIPLIGVGLGLAALGFWFGRASNASNAKVLPRLPGQDRPAGVAPDIKVPLKQEIATSIRPQPQAVLGKLEKLAGTPSDLPGLWPCFRGPQLNAICNDGVPLARQWPSNGPSVNWLVELGQGYAGPAVWNGRVYVLDYDKKASSDILRCLSLADGKDIWRFSYPVLVNNDHGMSRTVPAVSDKYVVTIGPRGHVACLDPLSGACRWMLSLERDFGATIPDWHNGQCPLIENGNVILAPGGPSLLVAVACPSGNVVWKSPNPRAWKMTHSSIAPMEFAGRRMYVYCGSGGVAGVAADDGQILWDSTAWPAPSTGAMVPVPVVLPDGKLFLCGGYDTGAMILQLKQDGDHIVAHTVRKLKPREFSSMQQTPILYEGHLYGVREKDKQMVCMDLDGNEVWASGPTHRFGGQGFGPYMVADKMLYILHDSGKLTLADASPAGYKQLAEYPVLDGHDAWGPMAMAHGRLLLRDFTRMVSIDVAKK